MEKGFVKVEKVVAKGKKYIVKVDTTDKEYKFSENQIVTNRIIKGAIFTVEEWDEILNSQNCSLLYEQMLHFIDYKFRTKKEVVEKLESKKASLEDIEIVIERLIEVGFIDDTRYANLFVQDALRYLRGPSYIKFTLEQKGIETSLINNELSNIDSSIFQENANLLASKCQKNVSNYPANKQIELIMQKLARNGYSFDMVNKAVRTLTFEDDNLEKLEIEYEKLYNKTQDKNKTITSLIQKGYRYEDIKKVIN